MESTSFTLSVKQEAAPRQKRKAKKRAVWPHLLMQAFLAAVLLYEVFRTCLLTPL